MYVVHVLEISFSLHREKSLVEFVQLVSPCSDPTVHDLMELFELTSARVKQRSLKVEVDQDPQPLSNLFTHL